MNTVELYKKLLQLGERLYRNDSSAWEDLRALLPELSEFVSEAVAMSKEMENAILNCFPRLLDAIKNIDIFLAADTVYHEISEIVAVYIKIINGIDVKDYVKRSSQRICINTKEIYNKNIECLSSLKKLNYQKIEDYCRDFDLNDTEIAVDEYGNIAVLEKDRWWRINSFYNSEYVAELALEEIKRQNYISALYIFGMGNMDTVQYLVEHAASDTMIFIYEPNPKILGINCYYHDWTNIFSKENVFLFVKDLNEKELQKCTFIYIDNVTYLYSYVYIQPEYGKVYYDEINDEIEKCKKTVCNAVYSDNTIDRYAEMFNYNRIMNLPYIYKSVMISDIKSVFESELDMANTVAVLVAAGPSLDDNIEELKKIKDRAFVIAVDSAIMMCEKYGVKPDAIVTIDPQKQEILFENETANNAPLFWGLPSVYKQVKRLQGKKVFCHCDSCIPKEISDREKYISPGGSVSNFAFSILNYLGFHKVIAIGLDLAFLKERKHTSVIYDDGGINIKQKEAYTFVKGQNGEDLLTYKNFILYKEDIEKRIAERKDELVFINASKGVYIEGAQHMSFIEAIKKYIPVEKTYFEALINKSKGTFVNVGESSIKDSVESYVNECNAIYDNYKQCYQLYDGLKKISDKLQITEIMQDIDELYMKSERCFTGKMIADASSMETDKIIQTMYKESTNQDTYSKEDINAIAGKGMRMAEIFMKNAKKTKELFEESLETFNR